jgi:phenylacetate-CoA ligase
MTVVAEHTDTAAPAARAAGIRSPCGVRCTLEIVAPRTLPKAEMKAKRVFDESNKR